MKISVITVAFNSASTITDTICSVREQNYQNYEHLIIDGFSTDDTAKIVRSLEHPRLLLKVEPDDGIYDAMNKGIQQAQGDIIGILNSDDIYVHPNVLGEVVAAFLADPLLDVVLGDIDFVNAYDSPKPIRKYRADGFRPWMFQIGLMPPHPAAFVRKSSYEKVGLYKLDYKIAADFEFLVRLLAIGKAKYCVVGKHWVRMRTGGISTSSWRSNVVITKEMLRALRENKIYSCLAMLLLRLPIKFFSQVLR